MAVPRNPLPDLQAALEACALHDVTSTSVTTALTRQVLAWARRRGWNAHTEWEVPGYEGVDGRRGLIDIFLQRLHAGMAIEIDRSNKQKSIQKLLAARETVGCEAVWVRWQCGNLGSDLGIAVPREISVVPVNLKAPVAVARTFRSSQIQPDRNGERWTPDEERYAVHLYRASRSIDQVASHLGRTRGGIEARLERLGVLPRY